ncbi:hypothetical protein [Pacificibacter maritimus]|uniref:hypothetical protein n=1 Tax=Pacificibacter maritimus TaxID=762213 RepID=UPI000F51781E|nr:hypothetical protein [Pacificibacter maritimus]
MTERAKDFTVNLSHLDTVGDGPVGDAEFAAYRIEKQARGEFIPLNAPASPAVPQVPLCKPLCLRSVLTCIPRMTV